MFSFKVTESEVAGNKRLVVEFSGQAVLESADEVFAALVKIVELKEKILLDFSRLEKVDVSFFQLVLSFKKTVRNRKSDFAVLSLPSDSALWATMKTLGLGDFDSENFMGLHYESVGREDE